MGTPRIDHAAAWVGDLERAREFYRRWFQAESGERYSSARRPLETYFLSFGGGTRLEIMQSPEERARPAHLAISLGSREAVDEMCARMREAGVRILSEPRVTGDGCYEAVVEDSEGNPVEIVA